MTPKILCTALSPRHPPVIHRHVWKTCVIGVFRFLTLFCIGIAKIVLSPVKEQKMAPRTRLLLTAPPPPDMQPTKPWPHGKPSAQCNLALFATLFINIVYNTICKYYFPFNKIQLIALYFFYDFSSFLLALVFFLPRTCSFKLGCQPSPSSPLVAIGGWVSR